jgi:homocysteine S-methyltransferase
VKQWHISFLSAGSNVITTNTYQIPLVEDIPEIDIPTITRSAVEIALNAARGRGSVALSFGTRNAGLGKQEYAAEPKATVKEYTTYHRQRIRQFHSATQNLWEEIDYLAFETVSSYDEAEAILAVISEEEITLSKKTWITFSCGDASISRMNDIFSRLLELPTISTLWGIGVNCVGIDIVGELAKMVAEKIAYTKLTLVVYPDAGRWENKTTAQFTYEAPAPSDNDTRRWAEALIQVGHLNGAKVLLGGCCNTDARFISALSTLSRNM